jgi:hypothetical protein
MYRYADYPRVVCEDIVRLRRCIARAGVPARKTDDNLIIGTWNIRQFGTVYQSWDDNPGSPKRNLRGLAYIAEVVRHYDVIAIQEIKRDTEAVRLLVDEFLGPNWGLMLSDVSGGALGNSERLGFLYDRRRIAPSGLAGEVVLPPTAGGNPAEQFDRTPYVVGFRAGSERFSLLTAHIRYGKTAADRRPEIERLARYTADELRDRARSATAEESNLIVLGDFNIDRRRLEDPLYAAFVASGLTVPEALRDVQSNYGQTVKHYDQIAWFMGDLSLLTKGAAGVIDFRGAVFREFSARQVTDRLSDHLPLWVEFLIDRSTETLARALGVDAASPDPFSAIPD